MFGLGKRRSKYGEFLDKNGIEQERIREATKLSRNTISKACSSDEYPSGKTTRRLLDAARKLTGKNVGHDDFWPM